MPVAWIPLTLLHPFEITDVTRHGQEVRWIAVHAVMLVLTPLLAIALLVMLGRLAGLATTIARIAIVVWASAFAAFETVAGIATGVLARIGEPSAAEALFDHGVVGGDFSLLALVAHPVWGVATVAAAVAMRAGGIPRVGWTAMAVSALFTIGHAGPLGLIAFGALAIGLWVGLRAQLVRPTAVDDTMFAPAGATTWP